MKRNFIVLRLKSIFYNMSSLYCSKFYLAKFYIIVIWDFEFMILFDTFDKKNLDI